MVNFDGVKSERKLRDLITRNLNKEFHAHTKPSIDFIYDILEKAYQSGLKYDVTNMRGKILAFAASSTNNSEYCIKRVNKMQFKSDEPSEAEPTDMSAEDDIPYVFFDIEVFPNLFLVNWKLAGEGNPVIRMINPEPRLIEDLMRYRLIGFNCRRYDNHLLYARLMGYNEKQLYDLSQKIINGSPNCFFGEAYNVSYTDVYDFASAGNKKSLKKFEIELGIHHQELGLPWDQPVPENMWIKVAEYCDNDVLATEAVFNHLKADWTARLILADVAGMTPNDTTNSLTTRIIFGKNKKPQSQFNYRNMGDVPKNASSWGTINETTGFANSDEHSLFDEANRPVFPGYKFEFGKSTYRGEEVGEGGYVYSEPGMYWNVALLDIASMHPSSIIAEELFGKEYTRRFKEIRDARIAIKHKEFDVARKMLDGKLAKYLTDESAASDLASALKTAINSVYGLTSAAFDNPFRDIRNKDNIVAKRGALFMINLKHFVQERGFTVAHIKTDSIKIPDATPEIIQAVMDYGAQYGYTFEHEATYDRMCLVNDAVYIAQYKDGKHAGEWTATGTQFAVPYLFKTLFSKEPIEFRDMCETKSATSALYLDFNEDLPDVTAEEKKLEELKKQWKGCDDELTNNRMAEQNELIAKGHNYHFVGKVGQFCPIKSGCGGAKLLRIGEDKYGFVKYSSAGGAKDYRWMESEQVAALGKEACIDREYYETLVRDAIADISQYGDFDTFLSGKVPPLFMRKKFRIPNNADVAPWETPCGKNSCDGCPEFHNDEYHCDCRLGYDVSFMLKPF